MSKILPCLDDIWSGANYSDVPDDVILDRRRRYRTVMVGAVGISYAIDVLFLYLFYRVGRIPEHVPIMYALAGAAHVFIFSLLHWSGISERARNPHLTVWQMAFSIIVQLVAMTLAPQIKGYFLALIFIIFSFGALRLSVYSALAMWLASCLATAYALLHLPSVGPFPGIYTFDEVMVVASSFSVVLLRCLLLNYYGTLLRMRMIRNTAALTDQVRAAQDMATRDRLTGALNRHAILPILEDQIQLAMRKGMPCVVAMIDIDHFKSINDRFGHLVGDAVLLQLVGTIEESLRPTDKVARYGGEEFLLLMPCTVFSEGLDIVERVREAVSALPWEATAPGLKTTFSAGVTNVVGVDSVKGVLSRADASLYRAKHSGRNRSVSLPAGAAVPSSETPVATAC